LFIFESMNEIVMQFTLPAIAVVNELLMQFPLPAMAVFTTGGGDVGGGGKGSNCESHV
jgi:hypothetical protein